MWRLANVAFLHTGRTGKIKCDLMDGWAVRPVSPDRLLLRFTGAALNQWLPALPSRREKPIDRRVTCKV